MDTMRIIIFDSRRSRWAKKDHKGNVEYTNIYKALLSASGSKPVISAKEGTSFIETFGDDDIILLHETDVVDHLYNKAAIDLVSEIGPKILKFSGGRCKEESNEHRGRVYALYRPISDAIFTEPKIWIAILRYILDPEKNVKPGCMRSTPVRPIYAAALILLQGYSLTRPDEASPPSESVKEIIKQARGNWERMNPAQRAAYWEPVLGSGDPEVIQLVNQVISNNGSSEVVIKKVETLIKNDRG